MRTTTQFAKYILFEEQEVLSKAGRWIHKPIYFVEINWKKLSFQRCGGPRVQDKAGGGASNLFFGGVYVTFQIVFQFCRAPSLRVLPIKRLQSDLRLRIRFRREHYLWPRGFVRYLHTSPWRIFSIHKLRWGRKRQLSTGITDKWSLLPWEELERYASSVFSP